MREKKEEKISQLWPREVLARLWSSRRRLLQWTKVQLNRFWSSIEFKEKSYISTFHYMFLSFYQTNQKKIYYFVFNN